jgi:hypothetical protein
METRWCHFSTFKDSLILPSLLFYYTSTVDSSSSPFSLTPVSYISTPHAKYIMICMTPHYPSYCLPHHLSGWCHSFIVFLIALTTSTLSIPWAAREILSSAGEGSVPDSQSITFTSYIIFVPVSHTAGSCRPITSFLSVLLCTFQPQ